MPIPLLPQETLDFTGLSREDMLVRLQSLANQAQPAWQDFSTAYPENIVLELAALHGDILRGVFEERVRQLSWATITDRLAAIRLGKQSSFTFTNAVPSTVELVFTTANDAVVATRVPIPEGTIVVANDIRYRVTSTGLGIEVGNSSQAVNAEQAEEVSVSFSSLSEPNMEFLLERAGYVGDSLTVTASDGAYTATDIFSDKASTDRVFMVAVDNQERGRVRFGNGVAGAIPQGTVSMTYRVTAGAQGAVEQGVSWKLDSPLIDELGATVRPRITNALAAQPGTDALTVAEARIRAPLAARTAGKRATIESDHEDLALTDPTIARAFLATSESSELINEDEAVLFLVAYGAELSSGAFEAAEPSSTTLTSMAARFAKDGASPTVMGVLLSVQAAPFYTVNVTARIYKTRGAKAADVSAAIRSNLRDLFSVANAKRQPNAAVDFGFRLQNASGDADFLFPWSSVYNAVRDAEGVRRLPPSSDALLLNSTFGDVHLQPSEFPVLGTVTIYDMDQSGQQI